MDFMEYKKADFKLNRKPVYEGYLCGTFQGYYYKDKRYKLIQERTANGVQWREKFVGYGYSLFHRGLRSWNEWKELAIDSDFNF